MVPRSLLHSLARSFKGEGLLSLGFGCPACDRVSGRVVFLNSVFAAFGDPVFDRGRHRYRSHGETFCRQDMRDIRHRRPLDYFDHNLFHSWRIERIGSWLVIRRFNYGLMHTHSNGHSWPPSVR